MSVQNPDFSNFAAGRPQTPTAPSDRSTATAPFPNGTLTPLYVIPAMIVAHDGTIYATTIYTFTLLKIETVRAMR